MKILIAGFRHETNTFAPSRTTYDDFINGGGYPAFCRGADLLSLSHINIPIAGFINALKETDYSIEPVIWANACPSGYVSKQAYEDIAGEIVQAAKTQNFDAIYLDLHGAMVAEHCDDGEGELLERLRQVVGYDMPIVVTLDLHANVTERMIKNATAMIAFRTYPHIDMAKTGERAAKILCDLLSTDKKLSVAARRLPYLIPINAMCTDVEPARGIYQKIIVNELGDDSIVSLSFTPGFPAADISECGPVILGYGWDKDKVETIIDRLYQRLLLIENQWAVDFYNPDEAVCEALRLAEKKGGPVVIADTQDNPGAGAKSDSTAMLHALLRHSVKNAAIGLIHDPKAALAAYRAGIQKYIALSLGGNPLDPNNQPVRDEFYVEHIHEGHCLLNGLMLNASKADLGIVACLKLNDIRIVVSSKKVQMLDRNMYRIAGITPEKMQILVNKSSVHFRADFEPIASAILIAKAPAAFCADPSEFNWKKLNPKMRTKPGQLKGNNMQLF